MCDEFSQQELESLPLPKDWTANVRHAVLNVIGIVRIAMLTGREFLIQEDKPHLAHVHRLETEVAMLREELRIIDARTQVTYARRQGARVSATWCSCALPAGGWS